jgi:hypothetical protein
MRDREAALDGAIPEVAAILGNALVRLLFPAPSPQVDLPETESLHVNAGKRHEKRNHSRSITD